MATINKAIRINASVEKVWDALRDYGALHTRLAPGFVANTQVEPGARIVTFGNGMSLREIIVTVDDAWHRLVWSARDPLFTHHNGSAQVVADSSDGVVFTWIADFLPDELEPQIAAMMEQGLGVIKVTLEKA